MHVSRRPLRIALLLLLVPFALACSGDDKPDATPTLILPPTPESTATPVPGPAPGTTVNITWTDEAPPTPDPAQEVARPWQQQMEPGQNDTWVLYVAENGGEPRTLLETHRWLNQPPIWSADGATLLQGYASRSSTGGATSINGYLQYRLAGPAGAVWHAQFANTFAAPNDTGNALLVAGSDAPDVYVVTPGGGSKALHGMQGQAFYRSWASDGRSFVLFRQNGVPGPVRPAWDIVAVTTGANQASLLSTTIDSPTVIWSPDSSRVAFIEDMDLIIFDVAARTRVVAPLGKEIYQMPDWSADGRYVAVSDGVVEAATGRVVIAPKRPNIINAKFSPDSRTIAITEDVFGGSDGCGVPPTGDFKNLHNRTFVIDIATGVERVLLDCDRGFHAYITEWLPNGRLLMGAPNCWGCESSMTSWSLITPQGEEMPLTDGLEREARVDLSPDGKHIVVTGKRLRIYSETGAVERTIEPPAGYVFVEASWGPDSRSFAFAIGPQFFCCV